MFDKVDRIYGDIFGGLKLILKNYGLSKKKMVKNRRQQEKEEKKMKIGK